MNEFAEHLAFFRELGVTGVSRDAAWRRRPAAEAEAAQAVEAVAAPGDGVVVAPAAVHADSAAVLQALQAEIGPACTRCKLCTLGRSTVVFGSGSPRARLMFVGEAPGEDEDRQGLPFVGRAGQLLTRIIEAIGLTREQVYIANVVKSRPPENRTPERDEVATCLPFLLRQIAVIRPQLIVTLGNPATQALLDTSVGITRLRGSFHDYPHLPGIRVMPTYHPAYLLRSPDKKRETWEDLKKVRDLLSQLSS